MDGMTGKKEYSGPVKQMRESPWLSSEDLEDPNGEGWLEATVTIERVLEILGAKFKGGRSKEQCYAVQFVGKSRLLVLNTTNRETLKTLCGRKATEWIGNQITLFVDPNVPLAGKRVPGIRIKPAPKREG